ncbi:unnamed protein product [Candidula unifasciata]|uniref:EGF-like domain-containing protein n=1 Tax=Candidula unifasciata TaxID=100452 RepID=A0A8S3ZCL3_9EUPU|nr:unnamed protein product [Candidula unifasciata]
MCCSGPWNTILALEVVRNYVTSCPSGWFGSQCKYKCRCVNNACDASGQCAGSYTCQGGWFGPACQYADLAFAAENASALTDGDDSTCDVAPDVNKTLVTLQEPTFFTWLRIRVTDDGLSVCSSICHMSVCLSVSLPVCTYLHV